MSQDGEDLRLHSELGASGAHRWRPCPGSVALSRGLPDRPSLDAAEGTVFHEFAALCLEIGLPPHGFIGQTHDVPPFGKLAFTAEMANHMAAGLDYLWAAADVPGAKLYVEQRVDLSAWTLPGEFGTTDACIVDLENRHMTVFDWKFGAGVPVKPERNDQAILYALGAWSTFAGEQFYDEHLESSFDANLYSMPNVTVDVVIEQPRAPGGGGVWKTSMAELLTEGQKIREDARKTTLPDAPIVPGEKQCRFCRAAQQNVCKVRARFLLDLALNDFDFLEDNFEIGGGVAIRTALSPKERSQVLLHSGMITKYLEQLHKEAYHDAQQGRETPGMKMVVGRSPAREWLDEEKAAAMLVHKLGDQAYRDPKLLTPAQVEDTVGRKTYKDLYAKLARQGQGQPILVPEDDPREPVKSPQQDFDSLLNLEPEKE